jgi:hypothetical protein
MRMIEASLFPTIPYLSVQNDNQEVMSMTDYAYGDRSKSRGEKRTIEARVMFGICYVIVFFCAVVSRLMPWRRPPSVDLSEKRESIFAEARSAAGTIVTSSFMGL